MSRRSAFLYFVPTLLGLAACSDRIVFFERPWPKDHYAVIVVVDESERPIDTEPRLLEPDRPATFAVGSAPPYRIHAYTYPAGAGGSDLEECGVAFGGMGEVLDPPATAWSSDLISSGDEETLVLRSTGIDAIPFELKKARCLPPPPEGPCETISAMSFRAGALRDTYLRRVVIASHDFWFAQGEEAADETIRLMATLGPTSGARVDMPPIRGKEAGLVYDASNDVAFAAWRSGELVQVDRSARVVASLEIPSFVVMGIAADGPGKVIVFGPSGAYEWLARTSTATQLAEPFPPDMTALHISGARKTAIAGGRIWDFDGDMWRPAIGGEGVQDNDRDLTLSGTAEVTGFVGEHDVRMRVEASTEWLGLEHPFVSGETHSGVVIGRGLLVVGYGARSALWHEGEWCRIETGGFTALRDVASSPDGHFAVAVGSGTVETGGPLVTTFEIPILP